MMKKLLSLFLLCGLAVPLAACQLGIVTPPPPTPVPTWTPSATPLPPTATVTPTPTITPTPPLNSSYGPPLISLAMFTNAEGWGVIENQLLLTNDGGVSWLGVPVPCGQFSGYNGVFFQDVKTAYILTSAPGGASGILCVTFNRGQDWEQIPVPPAAGRLQFFSNAVEGFILEDKGLAAGSQAVAIYSTIDRVTWNKAFEHDPANPLPENLPLAGLKSGMYFINPGSGWITGSLPEPGQPYFYSTGDGGRNWTSLALPIAPAQATALIETRPPSFVTVAEAFLPVDFLLSDDDQQTVFYYSADDGLTWTPTTPLPRATAYQFVDSKIGWAWAGHKLYFTADGAQTWTIQPFSLPARENVVQFNFINPVVGWMLTVDDRSRVHLYRTSDSAGTWTVVIP